MDGRGQGVIERDLGKMYRLDQEINIETLLEKILRIFGGKLQ